MQKTESEFLYHTSCDNCNSSDANSVYSDGHTYCFSCNTTTRGNDLNNPIATETSKEFIEGSITELSKRKINYNDKKCNQFTPNHSSLKSSDKEFTQYRRPVFVGPSGNT